MGRPTRSDTISSLESFSNVLRNRSRSAVGRKKRSGSTPSADNTAELIEDIPYRVEHLLEFDRVPRDVQIKHAWNADDKSNNIFIQDDQMTLHRRPISQSTDCIRGKEGYSNGLHIWEITWTSNQRGTHACVGVATKYAPLRKAGYCALVGNCEESWGWDLGRNILRHDNEQITPACVEDNRENHNQLSYPPLIDHDTSFIVPSTFMCVLDMDAGTMGFIADGQWLGTAFKDLNIPTLGVEEADGVTNQTQKLYPIVSCVWGHCEVTMKYVNGLDSQPLSLKELSRRTIRSSLQSTSSSNIAHLPLPQSLKRFNKDYGLKYYYKAKNMYKTDDEHNTSGSDV